MRNIDAFAPGGRARYHIVTDEPPNSTVRLSLCRLLGPASPLGGRVHLYSLSQAPKEAHDLMAQLRLLTRGPGYTYLWKNLLHYVLPSAVRRVLLLDADIMVSAPIAELWSHFGAGSYKMLVELGGRGYNTGVMLMWLERMRRSQLYQRVVAGFASQQLPRRLASGPTLEELGWNWFRGKPNNRTLGMADGGDLFYSLPCGWNRQMSPQYWPAFHDRGATAKTFHRCPGPCFLLHANCKDYKPLVMQRIHDDPSGATCAATFHAFIQPPAKLRALKAAQGRRNDYRGSVAGLYFKDVRVVRTPASQYMFEEALRACPLPHLLTVCCQTTYNHLLPSRAAGRFVLFSISRPNGNSVVLVDVLMSLASVVGEPSQLLATALEARAFMQQREAILQLARRQQLLIQELERLRRSKGAGSTSCITVVPAPAIAPTVS
ncbi:hypothetical protein EMIHUDRAFT_252500 [Emiliania huxleyi CCMP1516]|uniref:Uncharacterized protein n=2 Tax=Emiliania huxleyi TaxID=2903 RepID=A0A0D3KJH1_EMIH1|nr:hypothetical protein EMIHUDRAFT_252500 [Emiliania huxleyi CCMP1516]EOD35906.1 hypothetical protein EMIHUDRAFT_252500 [Emiliania huxleyi CCMP1516]|eukprot:XP_005788335.1 hypothetical protein EMIHUDRAFT_252500 [Emiliania huxleyi CCMP1516]